MYREQPKKPIFQKEKKNSQGYSGTRCVSKRSPHGTMKSHDFVFKLVKTIKAFKKILTVYHIR